MLADIFAALAKYEAPSCTGARRLLAPRPGFGADTPAGEAHTGAGPTVPSPAPGGESIYELVRGHGVSDDRLPGSTRQRPGVASA